MRLIAALEWEKQRPTVADHTKVMLSKEGKFFHVYNKSAWLLKTQMCTEELQRQRGDAKPINASHYVTAKSDYAMIGFPMESLSKFLVGYTQAQTLEGGDIVAEIASPFGPDTTVEQLDAAYGEWVKQLPKKENGQQAAASTKKPERPQGRPLNQAEAATLARSGMFGILQQVLSYPVEDTTPQENIAFISHLKQQVAGLL